MMMTRSKSFAVAIALTTLLGGCARHPKAEAPKTEEAAPVEPAGHPALHQLNVTRDKMKAIEEQRKAQEQEALPSP